MACLLRVLYQRDPVLPFQFVDQLRTGGLDSVSDCLNLPKSDDPVCDLVEKLEQIHKKVFSQTSQNIKKAQKHQAKYYNARHCGGTPFKVGERVLKRNMRDASRKQKMKNKYTGPYQITGISSNGQCYLKDKYSHQLKRLVPANQVVRFYGVGGFCKKTEPVYVENCENSSDEIGDAASGSESIGHDSGTVYESQSIQYDVGCCASDSESIQHDDNGIVSDSESMQDSDTDSNMHDNNCQRSRVHCQPNQHEQKKQENLVPSQIMIMQSNDTPFSSDESVLDVGVDDNVQDKIVNPWGRYEC